MKYVFNAGIALLFFGFSQISSEQKTGVANNVNKDTSLLKTKKAKQNKKMPIYVLPEDVTTDTGKASFVKNFYKGKIIYTQTCAKCHDSTKNNQKFYPDFSLPQLMDYEMRFQYPAHQEDLKETNITHDELEMVILFLRYKNRNLPVGSK